VDLAGETRQGGRAKAEACVAHELPTGDQAEVLADGLVGQALGIGGSHISFD
jgi:hypothetical protein